MHVTEAASTKAAGLCRAGPVLAAPRTNDRMVGWSRARPDKKMDGASAIADALREPGAHEIDKLLKDLRRAIESSWQYRMPR